MRVEHSFFFFSPRFARLIRIDGPDPSTQLLELAGLHSVSRRSEIFDPALRVQLDFDQAIQFELEKPCIYLRLLWKSLSIARWLMPLSMIVAVLSRTPRCGGSTNSSLHDIGIRIHGLELVLGKTNCFVRSLVTAFVLLRQNQPCCIVMGAILPSDKLHMWCVSDGAIPYEPDSEHFLYKPLIVFDFSRDRI